MRFKFFVFKNFNQKVLLFLTLILIIIIICIVKTSVNRKALATLPVPPPTRNIAENDAIVVPQINKKSINSQANNNMKIESNLPTDFKGYIIAALLEIPKIELSTYVLDEYSEDALNTSVVKLTGPSPNQIGNFCIVGHNYIKDNMFSKLKKLEIGDQLFLTDNLNRRIEYEVYSIDKVTSKDLDCLTQDTNHNKEVTLITCTTGALKRLIVKCTEVVYE